ncbi:MAG: thioredoxin [Sulfolobales archaeon]|nr:thioredoxin [Sulfolobales archaeon]MCG2894125.1 thioredoxin [Sulfolobales archaeon]MCG2910179.1 thioredoxin [Sulfolobales archaeon]MCI4455469.1 thioredoxin [Sulfolobus sp.]
MSEIDRLIEEISRKLEELAKGAEKVEYTVNVTDANFEDVISKNNVVFVDCWAPWCAPCHIYEPIFNKVAEQYKDKAVFARLNVDENPRTADKYNVMNIPTTLIFVKGKLVDQIVGAVDEDTLKSYVEKYISES